MQAVISRRSPTSFEQYVYMEDDKRVQVDFLGVVRLSVSTRNFLELQDVAYMSSREIWYQYLFCIDFDIVFFWNWKS